MGRSEFEHDGIIHDVKKGEVYRMSNANPADSRKRAEAALAVQEQNPGAEIQILLHPVDLKGRERAVVSVLPADTVDTLASAIKQAEEKRAALISRSGSDAVRTR
jgi:hypothetical protein